MIFRRNAVIALALISTIVSSLLNFPFEITYFNEISGGAINGRAHLVHSNLDWGQGLVELGRVLDRHPEFGPVAIVYSGPFSPDAIGSRAMLVDWNRRGSPLESFRHVAISVNILAGEKKTTHWHPGTAAISGDLASFFSTQTPVHRVDGSILLFEAEPYNEHFLSMNQSAQVDSLTSISADAKPITDSLPSLAVATRANDLAVSGLLHLLMLNGMGETGLARPTTGMEAFRILTDERLAKAAFGESPFIKTRYGIRYRLPGIASLDGMKAGESHRDQCLACFASLGMPIDTPVILEERSYTLKDLLAESIANFTFDQGELTWTAQSYSHYVAPNREWTNRFGKKTSFSDLARNLMEQDLKGQSCSGLHLMSAMVDIINADSRYGLLETDVRVAARAYLKKSVDSLVRNQATDGSWDSQWYRLPGESHVENPSFMSQVISTGHALEMLHKVNPPPPPQTVVKATRWLMVMLNKTDFNNTPVGVCPLTHSLLAVKISFANRSASYELTSLFSE